MLSLRKMDPVRIQADTMGFADRFVAAMSDAYDEIDRNAPSAAARDVAHRLKTDMAIGAIGNAVNPRPIAGMMDMVAMVTLLRRIADDPWTARTLGPNTRPLVDRLVQLEGDAHALAARYLTDQQLAEIRQAVDQWRAAHPDERYVSHLHLADLPAANLPPEVAARDPGSVFGLMFVDLTAGLDPAVREVVLLRQASERMFYYLQRLPMLIQLQTEGSLRGALAAPQFTRAADNVAAIAASTTRFAEINARFTDAVARFPEQLSAERQATLGQLAAAVAAEREAAIRQITEAVATQQQDAIAQAATRLAAERDVAIRQAAAAFRQEQRGFVQDSEAATTRSLDRLTWRLASLITFLMVLYILTSLAMTRFRRPRRTPLSCRAATRTRGPARPESWDREGKDSHAGSTNGSEAGAVSDAATGR